MTIPTKVKFIGYKKNNPLYEVGLTRNKLYMTSFWDDVMVKEIYDESGTVTVIDNDGHGHEIEYGDYEVKTWN